MHAQILFSRDDTRKIIAIFWFKMHKLVVVTTSILIMKNRYQDMKLFLVSDLRREYSKNNAFAVNHSMFNIVYGTVFRFLDPNTSRH